MVERNHRVRSLERGIEVLSHLSRLGSCDLQTLAKASGIPRSSVYRLIDTLKGLGLVQAGLNGESYYLAGNVLSLSAGYSEVSRVREAAKPVLVSISAKTGWPVGLTVYDAPSMLMRETTYGLSPFSLEGMQHGDRLSLTRSAAGLAYLSACSRERRRLLLKQALGRRPVGAPDGEEFRRLEADIVRFGRQGYSVYRRTARPFLTSLAVPIADGAVIHGCLSTIWISARDTDAKAVDEYPVELAAGAERIRTLLAVQ